MPKTYSLKDVLYKTTASSIKETFIILCHTAVFVTILILPILKMNIKVLASPLLHHVKYLEKNVNVFFR